MRKRTIFLICFFLINTQVSHASWIQDSDTGPNGSLNLNASWSATWPRLVMDGDIPYVIWWESDGTQSLIYVKSYNGSAWSQVGSGALNIDSNYPAKYPDIAYSDGNLYATWIEVDANGNTLVWSKQWDGMNWQPLGSYLNLNPNEETHRPNITADNGIPYVTWVEYESGLRRVYIKKYNGSSWERLGTGYLNIDTDHDTYYPDIDADSGIPYIVYRENWDDSYVKYFDGSGWVQIGSGIKNTGEDTHAACIDVYNGTPYVSFHGDSGQYQVYVKKYNSASWETLGDELNTGTREAVNSRIAVWNDQVFATWHEVDFPRFHVYSEYYDDGWISTGGELGLDSNTAALNPDIDVNTTGVPYVVWSENDGSNNQIYVKHYVYPTSTPTPTPTGTATITPTFTISATNTISPTITMTPTITPTSTISPTTTKTSTITKTSTTTPTISIVIKSNQILAYPNPAKNQINFMVEVNQASIIQVRIFNINGEKIAEIEESHGVSKNAVIKWNCQGLAPGIYFVKTMVGGKIYKTKKIAIFQ